MAKNTRTIQEIAQLVDVPVQIVSKVILGQPGVDEVTRSRIQKAMTDVGLIQVSLYQNNVQNTIVAVIPGPIIEDYIGSVVQGISEVAERTGYALEINVQNPAYENTLVDVLSRRELIGVIPIVPHNYAHIISLCKEFQRDYVLIDYQEDDPISQNVPTVEVNNYQGMKQVMQHLFQLGHRRIGFITGFLQHVSAQQRLQAYQDALMESLILYEPALVREGNWMHQEAYQHAVDLLQMEHPPTAIVGSNDLTAFGIIHAVREMGLEVGGQISVTGFDDIAMAATINPSLTTVRQPMTALGAAAAEMLIKRLLGDSLDSLHVVLDTELIVRESTGTVMRY